MTDTLTFKGSLTVVTCWCGIRSAVPDQMYRWAMVSTGNGIHCPLGHRFVYRESEADALRAKLDQAEADAQWQRQRAERASQEAATERARMAAARAEVSRTRQRAAAGACPCCNRSFAQLRRHMETKHPDCLGGPELPDVIVRWTLKDAVLAVVWAAGEPMRADAVFGRLVLAGRHDKEGSVKATLYGVARSGLLTQVAPGTWAANPVPS